MEKKMYINAAHEEECRIAITEDNVLSELEIESGGSKKLKGNIYKAKVSRIEPSLQAAFLDIGTSRNGFLQINDIHPAFSISEQGERRRGSQRRIQDILEPGQELIVQVVKEEREMKGATLTTYLSLPGRYVVLMPGSERGGVSRKISDVEQRKRLKTLTRELEVPAGMGLIVRTAGLDRSQADLSRDLSLQLRVWEKIVEQAQTASTPTILYRESDLATRVIRDYFTPEIREIIIDDSDTFQKVREFVDQVMPRYRSRVKFYQEEAPLFASVGLEEQVGETLKSEVKLASGGALIIQQLEALVAIDVNSGKATAGGNIEETAYRTNLEAAKEVARQLRLRDLGGLVVIDFIDMLEPRHRSSVEHQIREAVKLDKARVEIGRVSKFGLLEMSRQRIRASLSSQSHFKCPTCRGTGLIKNPDHVALEVLRKVQAAVLAGGVSIVKLIMPPQSALLLLNNKRAEIAKMEQAHKVQILILPDNRMTPEEYDLELVSEKVA